MFGFKKSRACVKMKNSDSVSDPPFVVTEQASLPPNATIRRIARGTAEATSELLLHVTTRR